MAGLGGAFVVVLQHFSASVRPDVEAQVAGTPGSDFQAFCHPNQVHPVTVYRQRSSVNDPRPHHHHHQAQPGLCILLYLLPLGHAGDCGR